MSRLKVPVSKQDHKKGPEDARIELVEYGDFQCPYCALTHLKLKEAEEGLKKNVRFVFRHFPLTQIHEYALLGSLSAEAAGDQGKFWEMHDMIFENQTLLSQEGVERFAEELGLDMARFIESIENPAYANRIRQDFIGGVRSGVNGTPSFFLNKEKYEGPVDVGLFREITKAA